MRRVVALATLTLAASCGGSPMAPSTSVPQSASTLPSGAYRLTVSMSTSGNSGFSFCVSGRGEPPSFAAVSVPTPVQVHHSGNTIDITPDDPAATFRMQLQMSGANLSGTASGQFQSSATTVTVLGHAPPPALATATGIVGPVFASGALDGAVGVGTGTSGTVQPDILCTSNGHTWMLAPR
jgi:hypothetical protein